MKLKESMNHEQKKQSIEANPELMQTLVLSIKFKITVVIKLFKS